MGNVKCFRFRISLFPEYNVVLMRKIIGGILSGVLLGGCGAPVHIPLPKDHPAYGFYQTANTFNVSGQECSKLQGSLEIRPDKIGPGQAYEKIRELIPGLFLVKQKTTEKQFVTVLFMEYGLVTSLPRTCSWDLTQFPIEPDAH